MNHTNLNIECEKAIQLNPKDAGAYFNLGLVHKKTKNYQKAIECYEKAIQMDPNYAKVTLISGMFKMT